MTVNYSETDSSGKLYDNGQRLIILGESYRDCKVSKWRVIQEAAATIERLKEIIHILSEPRK